MRSKTWGLLATTFVLVCGLGVVLAQVSQDNAVSKDGAVASAAAQPLDTGLLVPIPVGAVFRPYVVGVGEIAGAAAAGTTGTVVYSNRLGNNLLAPGGVPGALVADDIAALASENCVLDSLRFRVSGDPLGDGSGVGPFSVTFALYSGCPDAGGFPLFPPVTEVFPDNGNFEVIFQPKACQGGTEAGKHCVTDADCPGSVCLSIDFPIPTNSYFGVRFDRSLAAIVSGASATAGFSADRYDFPGARCGANFGGFPGFPHGSFDLEIRSRNDCPDGICSSTCSGGSNAGGFCVTDDCPGGSCMQDVACLGGSNNGGACTTDADCPGICSGGSNNGNACTTGADCPNSCRGGSQVGQFCTVDGDCPGSTCSIGSCPAATCTRDKCVGGTNDSNFCFVDDCPSGSCDGSTLCDGGINTGQACVYSCAPSFPAYKNTSQGGAPFTSKPENDFFAEDIKLAVPVDGNNPCNLVSWEVGFKGGITGNGAIQAELHTSLDPSDPENGGRIAGTKVVDIISGSTVRILKRTFDPPIPITSQDLFVVFKTQNSFVGVIKTCKNAALGSTEDVYFVHDGTSWVTTAFPAPTGGAPACFAGFEVTLSCAGAPPLGACCDMALTEGRTCIGGPRDGLPCNRDQQCRVCIGGSKDGSRCKMESDCPGGLCPAESKQFCIGDAVCRNLPQMNCAFPTLWRQGESCGATCDGGALAGESCSTSFDCPAACVGGGRDGQPCVADSECPGVCEAGSAFAGTVCFADTDCRVSPFDPALCDKTGVVCGSAGVCRGEFCVGGSLDGAPCTRAIDCPGGECGSSCMGGDNDGLPCVQGSQCPGGFCPATPFPEPCGLGSCCTRNDLRCCETERDCHTAGTLCGVSNEPLETPVQFRVGLPCDQGTCPRGACISQEGDCTQAREGLCVGGTLNGQPCPFGNPCIPGINDCCSGVNAGVGVCQGNSGCESPVCCTAVCDINISCCSQHWSQTCANIAFEAPACQRIPANDTCSDPSPVKGALFLPFNSSVEVDLTNAQGGSSQPGLCCFRQVDFPGPGPGSQAKATVWLKTIAPPDGTCRGAAAGQNDDGAACTSDGDCSSGKCRANLSVDTCNTAGGGGDNSILQVFTVGDKDSGLCEDGAICSVSLQDCFDQSECVLNEESVCASLSPIGCSDDVLVPGSCTNGLADFPFNSRLCVDVVPGDPYYILVAAKDEAGRGKYRVTTSSFCTIDPPVLFNDLCPDALAIGANGFGCDSAGNCDEFFDLSGFNGAFAASTFDCPGPTCLNTMQNDVWFDWTAPASGRISVDTCNGANTPDTSLVIYNGCDCPVEIGTELGCSETELTSDCFLGSRVSAPVQKGNCYKLRLGGNFTSTPSGTLHVDFTACPPGPVSIFDPLNDPPDQTIDARAPFDPRTQQPLGIDSFTIKWVGGTTDKACYSYCETPVEDFSPNDLFGTITDNGNDTFTVNLARPMAPGAFGTLTVKHGDDTTSQISAVSLPGDADGDAAATAADLDFLIAGLNGLVPFDKYRHDMDHSGTLTPQDLLRWIDVTQGVSGAFQPWLGAPFPACAPCCPN